MTAIIVSIILAYLIGSIPTAVWYGRFFYKIDVREFGSGNSGATNSMRVMGKKAGFIVFLIDFLKGFLAYKLYFVAQNFGFYQSETINTGLLMAIAVVVGHIFPVFAGFKGGKGIATSIGVIAGIHFPAALVCMIVFVGVVFFTKYVSLGSILGAIVFPILIWIGFWKEISTNEYLIFGLFLSAILLLSHHENIKRLLSGTESKVGKKA